MAPPSTGQREGSLLPGLVPGGGVRRAEQRDLCEGPSAKRQESGVVSNLPGGRRRSRAVLVCLPPGNSGSRAPLVVSCDYSHVYRLTGALESFRGRIRAARQQWPVRDSPSETDPTSGWDGLLSCEEEACSAGDLCPARVFGPDHASSEDNERRDQNRPGARPAIAPFSSLVKIRYYDRGLGSRGRGKTKGGGGEGPVRVAWRLDSAMVHPLTASTAGFDFEGFAGLGWGAALGRGDFDADADAQARARIPRDFPRDFRSRKMFTGDSCAAMTLRDAPA
ncbi:unnamed protein product [Diplocarpon coronariae]